VGDFSNFGFTSPTQGGRYRIQATPNFGSRDFVNVLFDYRRYFFFNPVTFAVRAFQSGNYGATSENLTANDFDNLFIRESLGAPYQQAFVRGYSFRSFFNEQSCQRANQCEIDQLFGTRVGLVSAEFRLPLLGTDAFGLVNFPYIPTEFVVFGDAGIAWTNEDLRTLSFSTTTTANQDETSLSPGQSFGTVPAQPVTSAGVAARMNVLGSAIVEIFYARTFQRDQDWDFGLLLRPGW
jgi:outer membrane protein assembly factor BamA